VRSTTTTVETFGQLCRADVVLQRDVLAAAHAFVGSDHGAAVGIEDAVAQGVRGEAAEHHRVHGADACAGEHGVGCFGDHRHVDAHAVAFLHATVFQHVGQAADVVVQFVVGDVRGFGGVVAFPDDGDLFAALFQVTVDAVVGDVELATLEPFGAALFQVAAVHLIPGLEPVQKGLGLLAPEGFGLLDGLLVEAQVGVVIQVRALAHRVWHGMASDLEHGGVLVIVCPQQPQGCTQAGAWFKACACRDAAVPARRADIPVVLRPGSGSRHRSV
jgi:hypothetical protein